MTPQVGGAELTGSTVLILGGAGLVGEAVARALLHHNPKRVVIAGLTQDEAEESVAELRSEFTGSPAAIDAYWGDLFVPASMKDRPRREILDDPVARDQHAIERVRRLFAQALGYQYPECEPDYGLRPLLPPRGSALHHLPAPPQQLHSKKAGSSGTLSHRWSL